MSSLDRDRVGVVRPRTDVGGDDAAGAEARIERGIGVVAGERDVAVNPRGGGGELGGDDLTVGLDGNDFFPVVRPDRPQVEAVRRVAR
jgi:hypothetical protein